MTNQRDPHDMLIITYAIFSALACGYVFYMKG